MNAHKPILLVEDDEVDVKTVERAFKQLKIVNPLAKAGNGEEALEYLAGMGSARPCLILLDLNMPKMNGLEFLSKLSTSSKEMKRIPVVILTTSQEEEDKVRSYELKVAGYIIKPVEYAKFVESMRTIDVYWTLSELPSN